MGGRQSKPKWKTSSNGNQLPSNSTQLLSNGKSISIPNSIVPVITLEPFNVNTMKKLLEEYAIMIYEMYKNIALTGTIIKDKLNQYNSLSYVKYNTDTNTAEYVGRPVQENSTIYFVSEYDNKKEELSENPNIVYIYVLSKLLLEQEANVKTFNEQYIPRVKNILADHLNKAEKTDLKNKERIKQFLAKLNDKNKQYNYIKSGKIMGKLNKDNAELKNFQQTIKNSKLFQNSPEIREKFNMILDKLNNLLVEEDEKEKTRIRRIIDSELNRQSTSKKDIQNKLRELKEAKPELAKIIEEIQKEILVNTRYGFKKNTQTKKFQYEGMSARYSTRNPNERSPLLPHAYGGGKTRKHITIKKSKTRKH